MQLGPWKTQGYDEFTPLPELSAMDLDLNARRTLREALALATAEGPGGQPRFGPLGALLQHLPVQVEAVGGATTEQAVANGTVVVLSPQALEHGSRHVAKLLIAAAAVHTAAWEGSLLVSPHAVLVDPPAPALDDSGDPLARLREQFGSGEDLIGQVARMHAEAMEAFVGPAPPKP